MANKENLELARKFDEIRLEKTLREWVEKYSYSTSIGVSAWNELKTMLAAQESPAPEAERFNPETVKLMDLAARKTALLAMELARACLLSFSVQVSEHPKAQRIRDICYTLLGTTGHHAEPDQNAAFGKEAAAPAGVECWAVRRGTCS